MTSRGEGLGIDFGTSTTVSVLTGPAGRNRPLLFDASPLLVSSVFVAHDGSVLTGADAERAALAAPDGPGAQPEAAHRRRRGLAGRAGAPGRRPDRRGVDARAVRGALLR